MEKYKELSMVLRMNKVHFSQSNFRRQMGKKYSKQALRHNIHIDITKNLIKAQQYIQREDR
jgi:hypothetical protein